MISVGFCQLTVGCVSIGSIIENAQQKKVNKNANSVTLHPLGKAIWGYLWEYTVEKININDDDDNHDNDDNVGDDNHDDDDNYEYDDNHDDANHDDENNDDDVNDDDDDNHDDDDSHDDRP